MYRFYSSIHHLSTMSRRARMTARYSVHTLAATASIAVSPSPAIRHMDSQEARPAPWNQPCLGLLRPDWDESADRASTLTYTGISHSQARRTDDGTGLQSHCPVARWSSHACRWTTLQTYPRCQATYVHIYVPSMRRLPGWRRDKHFGFVCAAPARSIVWHPMAAPAPGTAGLGSLV